MFGHEYFYRGIIRKHISAFGSLFTDIRIKDWDSETNAWKEEIKVPISYGSKEKHLARVTIREITNESAAITLPRIAFVMTGVTYDSTRAHNKRNKFIVVDGEAPNSRRSLRSATPYDITFEVSVLTRKSEDATKIVEQIIPFFQPEFNVTIKFPFEGNESLGTLNSLSLDVPIILESVSSTEEYEGDFETRRAITWNISFVMKTWFFGPTTDSAIIKKTIIDFTEQNERVTGIPTVDGKTLDEIVETDDWEYTTNITKT